MAQNKIININEAKSMANDFVAKQEQQVQKRKNAFEEILNGINKTEMSEFGFEEFSSILALPEEHFVIVAPIFLAELEKNFSKTEDKIFLAQAANAAGQKLEDVQAAYLSLINSIDEQFADILTPIKRDFLKRFLSISYNSLAETEGVIKRIVQVPIELTSDSAKIPTYANLGDGAVDLYSPADYTINPGETVIIPCDIKVALPYGYAFLIHPRSGLSAKSKLRVANSIGLIDSQYKGVIGVIIENIEPPIKDITYEFDENGKPILTSVLHGQSYSISKGERFAQMRLVEVPTASFFQVSSVAEIGDDRGGGFGSSGTN